MAVGKVRTGVILIAIGVLLLLNTTDVVDLGFWRWIGKLWPVILIAIGIEKIFSHAESPALRTAAWTSPLLIVAVVAYAVVAGQRDVDLEGSHWNWGDYDGGSTSTSSWNVSFEPEVQRVDISLDLSGGRLTVRGGSDPGHALTGRASTRGKATRLESTISGGIQTIHVDQRDGPDHHGRDQWTIKLTDSLPVDLKVEGGAARMRLDLTTIKAESMDLDAGAAEVNVTFGSLAPNVTATIDCGAASVDITIPSTAGLRLRHEGIISNLSENNLDLVDQGSYSETKAYSASPVKIDMRINSAVSSLRLRRASGTAPSESI